MVFVHFVFAIKLCAIEIAGQVVKGECVTHGTKKQLPHSYCLPC